MRKNEKEPKIRKGPDLENSLEEKKGKKTVHKEREQKESKSNFRNSSNSSNSCYRSCACNEQYR